MKKSNTGTQLECGISTKCGMQSQKERSQLRSSKKSPAKTMNDMELYEAIGKMSDSELVELLCKIADEVEMRLLYGTPLDDKSDL